MVISDSQFEYLKRLSKLSFSVEEEKKVKAELEEFISLIDVIRNYIPSNPVTLTKEVSEIPKLTYKRPVLDNEFKDNGNSCITIPESINNAIAVKDNIMVKGSRTTAGSRILSNHIATFDADVITKLKNNGFDSFIKTNLDEFAMGFDSSTSYYGPVINPFDTKRISGGSSGGSAVCVSSGLVKYALGSDTGGSIRQPSSYLGLVGLKPTYGNVSRFGLISYASSFDQIGPITTTVSDSKFIYDIISEKKSVDSGIRGRVLVPDNLVSMCEYSSMVINGALAIGEGEIYHFNMPHLKELISCYYVIACAQCSSNLSRYDSDRYMSRDEGFGFETKKRILLGNHVLSEGFYDSYYLKAMALREELTKIFIELMNEGDVIVMPVTTSDAPLINSSIDPLFKYKEDIFTIVANLTGFPSITVPCGNSSNGLPIGLQIMGRPNSEGELFRLASVIETRVGGFR